MKITVNNAAGMTRQCKGRHCWHYVFNKDDNGVITCVRCKTPYVFSDDEVEAPFPRPRREFMDRLHQVQTYSFWRGGDDEKGSVVRVEETHGKWLDKDDVRALMDEAQEEINSLRDRLARLAPQGV